MFKDVGKEIKEHAELHVKRTTIRYALRGLAIGAAVVFAVSLVGSGENVGVAVLFALIVLAYNTWAGYCIGRGEAMNYYAWGEVVDRVVSLERKLSGKCDQPVNQPKKSTITPRGELVVTDDRNKQASEENPMGEGMPKVVRNADGPWHCLWRDDYITPANVKTCKKCGRVHEFE